MALCRKSRGLRVDSTRASCSGCALLVKAALRLARIVRCLRAPFWMDHVAGRGGTDVKMDTVAAATVLLPRRRCCEVVAGAGSNSGFCCCCCSGSTRAHWYGSVGRPLRPGAGALRSSLLSVVGPPAVPVCLVSCPLSRAAVAVVVVVVVVAAAAGRSHCRSRSNSCSSSSSSTSGSRNRNNNIQS